MNKVENYWEDYFNNVSPTWMENWYEDLKELTIPSEFFELSNKEREEIMRLLDGDFNKEIIDGFKKKLRWAFSKIKGDKYFVRLGSRSPKDNQTEIHKIEDVISAFGDSERILDDLMLCSQNSYTPCVFVREWKEIPEDKEFRCFVKNGKLKGISQYFYRVKYYYLDKPEERKLIEFQARKLLTKIKDKFKLNNFIFDIVYRPKEDLPLLIEINPYSSWTDPCLFDWAIDTFRVFKFKWLQSLDKTQEVSANSSQQ